MSWHHQWRVHPRGAEGGVAFYLRSDNGEGFVISGGSFAGGSSTAVGGNAISALYNGQLSISGGSFDAGHSDELDVFLLDYIDPGRGDPGRIPTTIEISGGQWGYSNTSRGFFFDSLYGESRNISFSGWDLKLEDDILSGFLLDGSWIEAPLVIGDTYRGNFSLVNDPAAVPEWAYCWHIGNAYLACPEKQVSG